MQAWGLTDTGNVRRMNQDAWQVLLLETGQLLAVVCDGMGGAKSGNIASTMTVDVFIRDVKKHVKAGMNRLELERLLTAAADQANREVYDRSRLSEEFEGMGPTLVAALVQMPLVCVINVGDSRCYHLHEQWIERVSVDHSLVEYMLQTGELTEETARSYPGRNLITRAVGTEPAVLTDVFFREASPGDCLLLCSDGLSNLVPAWELRDELLRLDDRSGCCQRLVDLTKQRGAPDNVTAVLVQL